MKKLLCLITLAAPFALDAKNLTYSWSGGESSTKIGFSLHNKSSKTLYVTVENDSLIKEKGVSGFLQKTFGGPNMYRVLKGAFLDLPLNIAKSTKLTLYDCSSLDECDTSSARIIKRVTFTPNKTMYINWDGSKIYKQQGPLKGLTKATDKGYELNNNVIESDIRSIQK